MHIFNLPSFVNFFVTCCLNSFPAKISQLCDRTNNNVLTSDIEIANCYLKGRQLSIVVANKSTFALCFIYFTAVKRFVVHLVDSSHESLMKSDHNRYLNDGRRDVPCIVVMTYIFY